MYIDFHIHAYADEIADRAVQKLKDTANCNVYTNGRIDDTRQKLQEWGIDYGVLLPVATKPTQQTTINNWANEQNHGNILTVKSFTVSLNAYRPWGFTVLNYIRIIRGILCLSRVCRGFMKNAVNWGFLLFFIWDMTLYHL